MSQLNYTTRGKYLTEVERYKIEGYLKANMRVKEIAEYIGKSERTIQREIHRGTVKQLNSDLRERYEYCADTAQMRYESNKRNKGRNYKISNDHELVIYLEEKIGKEGYSPDVAIGRIKIEGKCFKTKICTKTLYNYLDADLFLGISNKDLYVKKAGKKRPYKKRKVALNNIRGRSIEERPPEVNERLEYGHWEMDCVLSGVGKSKGALLTLTERFSREERIFKMPAKKQINVTRVINSIERKLGYEGFAETFKSITVDNGNEFLHFIVLEASILRKNAKRTKLYYAHPYSSWERGTNENLNKMIRRFVPKGSDISKISKRMVERIENWLNNYPRRILGYKTPNEVKFQLKTA